MSTLSRRRPGETLFRFISLVIVLFAIVRQIAQLRRTFLSTLGWLYQLANTKREKISILLFSLKWLFLARENDKFGEAIVQLQGMRYAVSLDPGEIKNFKTLYLERQCDQVAEFRPTQGWFVVDVGANAGIFTLQQAMRGARVLAIEPNPSCCKRIRRSAIENNLQHLIQIWDVAVGAKAGQGTLLVPSSRGTGTGIVLPIESAEPVILNVPEHNLVDKISMVQLDQIIKKEEIQQIDLLKIDVEGAEIEVLQGATHTLQLVKYIILEYHTLSILEKCKNLLNEAGFVLVLRTIDRVDSSIRGQIYLQRATSTSAGFVNTRAAHP